MKSRRATIDTLSIAVLACFAASIVPRAAVYTHRHDDTAAGHVHAWDASRLDDIRQLIDDVRGGNEHAHRHDAAGRDLPPDLERDRQPVRASASTNARHASRGPQLATSSAAGGLHSHWQAPLQTVARHASVAVALASGSAPLAGQPGVRPIAVARYVLRARGPPLSVL